MTRNLRFAAPLAFVLLPGLLHAADPSIQRAAIDRLVAESGETAQVRVSRATGAATFVRLAPGSIALGLPTGTAPEGVAEAFLLRHGAAFGITSLGAELQPMEVETDPLGRSRVVFAQEYHGVPVFGAQLRVHLDSLGRVAVVNGTFVPGIAVDPTPGRSLNEAGVTAMQAVRKQFPEGREISVRGGELMVFRSGLVQGVPGRDHLVWQLEVGDGRGIREFLYVDAHTLEVVDQITGIYRAITRRVDYQTLGNTVWNEGDARPPVGIPAGTERTEVDAILDFDLDVYDLFQAISGGTFPSWNAADGVMITVWDDPSINCPNANWNGVSTNYCPGVAGDDTVAHEWTHAYTDSTHNLIYQWQSGALNESFSDIFGETVDIINGQGTDSPDVARTDGECSTFGGAPPPSCTINSPAPIAGDYVAGGAAFNPAPPWSVTDDVELADDNDATTGTVNDGCQALVGFTAGNIALIERGECAFVDKVNNAFAANATGVIIVNNAGDGVINMGGTGPLDIPAVMIGQSDGDVIRTELLSGAVNATLEQGSSIDASIRWLSGEDDPAFGGAIRDLWSPNCFGDPGKVTDSAQFVCDGASDGGGVHTNSGIPNHAFALMVDGGTYNGVTVAGIGLTKAVHVYWQAMSVYQTPVTDFANHGDSMVTACADLVGVDLPSLTTGAPSGEVMTLGDCDEVDKALTAVEMWTAPDFCAFTALLQPNAPAVSCGSVLLNETFESDPSGSWSLDNDGVFGEYVPRDWEWTANVPSGGDGMAMFGIDSVDIGDCVAGSDDQSGVMHLDSPLLVIPGGATSPGVVFDHWVATEAGYDGGNLKISVNGGGFQLVDPADYSFNPYNGVLTDSAGGNTNPLAGEDAFTGANDGSTGSGSWGQSQVFLGNYASAGNTIRLRFDLGVDGCNGARGWYVDNVTVCGEMEVALFSDGFESGDVGAWSASNP